MKNDLWNRIIVLMAAATAAAAVTATSTATAATAGATTWGGTVIEIVSVAVDLFMQLRNMLGTNAAAATNHRNPHIDPDFPTLTVGRWRHILPQPFDNEGGKVRQSTVLHDGAVSEDKHRTWQEAPSCRTVLHRDEVSDR